VAVGVLTTAILAGAKAIIEHSTWGREGEVWAFGLLQGSLSSVDPDNPVILIDIGDVSEDSNTLIPTVREIVEALKNLDKRPIAVAVDVDFSPSGVISSGTSGFFDACLKRDEDDVPIYLAVGDNKSAPPEAWLGLDKYKGLAAAAAINAKDTRWIPIWVQAINRTEKLKTINYSLALEKRRRLPGPPSWISWAVDRSEEGRADTQERTEAENDEIILNYGERLVNYSKLDTMKTTKDIRAQSVKDNGASYSGKLVIIGDVTRGKDHFPVPWRPHDEAGSLLLACATYTLIKEPLFEFKSRVRLILDLLIAGLIIAMVAIIRYRNPYSLSWKGKQAMFIYMSIFTVGLAGYLLVRFVGVMWLDFLLVAFALSLHPRLDRLIHRILAKLITSTGSDPQPPAATGSATRAAICLLVTLMMTTTARAQQPADLCRAGAAAIALRFKLDPKPKPKPKRKKPTCQFRESDKDSWHGLSDADMIKKTFRAGQDLQCDKGCALVIFLCGTGAEYSVTKNEPEFDTLSNPYRVPRKVVDPNPDTPAKKPRWTAYRPTNPSTDVGPAAADYHPKRYGEIVAAIAEPTSPSRGESDKGTKQRFAALLELGNDLRDAKNYSEAEQAYLEAAKVIPVDSSSFYGLGNVYADQHRWKEAEEAYRRSVSLRNNTPEAYLALAAILLEFPVEASSNDRLSQAEAQLWNAAKMQPQNERVFDLLYVVLEKRAASPAEFEAAYRRVLTLNPKTFRTNLLLSVRLRRSGEIDEANKRLRIAAKAASDSQELLEVAEAFESERQYHRAEKIVRRALALTPKHPRELLILGLVLIDREKYAKALEPLEIAAKASPDDFAPHHMLGIAQLRTGKLDEAERSFNEAATKVRPGADQLFATACWLGLLGDAYSTGGRVLDAERVYERALGYEPDDLEIKNRLSKIRSRPKH